MTELIVIIFLLCFIVFLEMRTYYERKALTEKIMSRTYQEYVTHDLERIALKRKPSSRMDEELVGL